MLRVVGLIVHYGDVQVLRGISLEVREGEIVALIGANGAGKTTTLRTISGLHRPHGGEIEFKGIPIAGLPAERIAGLGMAHCPEGRRVWAKMTVLENLLLGGHLLRGRQKLESNLQAMFEMFPVLKQRQGQLAGSLSGGEQQMLAIARALMSNPTLLLLDEPSLGLAPKIVGQVGDIIGELRSRGIGILLVEQNARLALGVADRGYVMELGHIVLEGATEELRQNEHVRRSYLGR